MGNPAPRRTSDRRLANNFTFIVQTKFTRNQSN